MTNTIDNRSTGAFGSGKSQPLADQAPKAVGGLGRLAGWSYDHRRRVLIGWLVVLVAVIASSGAIGSAFHNNFTLANSPSHRAQELLSQRFPAQAGDTADVVVQTAGPVDDPANAATITRLVNAVRVLPSVTSVRGPLDPGASRQISADRHTAFAVVQFDKPTLNLRTSQTQRVINVAHGFAHPGFAVALGGNPISEAVHASPGSSEAIGILAAIIIMLIAFGSVVAMGLPLLTALIGLGISFGLVDFVSHRITVPGFGPEMMAMIGLGVGIDYALFIVTRYRQGLGEGRDPRQATVLALSTAGRAVLFAGSTVVIGLCGLFIVDLPFMYGLVVGAITAVVLVLTAALTLLPALLGFVGRNIDRLHLPGLVVRPATAGHGFWYRWSQMVQRRPWLYGSVALAILLVLAIPVLSLRMAFSDAGNDPTKLTTRQAYDMLARGFGSGFNGPLLIVADIPAGGAAGRAAVDSLDSRLHTVPGVASVAPPVYNQAGDAAVIIAEPTTSPQSAATASLVRHLRASVVPPNVVGSGDTVLVGGVTAAGIDAAHYMTGRLPLVIALVIVLAFILLMAVFRSVAIPLQAAVMNLLSIGAAYGVLVAVFQWGWLGSLFGVTRTGPIDPWIPMMMFTIVFGLSMDYEVFLMSRIREEWLRRGDNSIAVANGLASTARVITAAAAIMICVFGSFVINDPLRLLDVFGLGLATAIFIDATLVRMVLVPSVMQVLGRANWWMPTWLDRTLPTLGVEVATPAPPRPNDGLPGGEPDVVSAGATMVGRGADIRAD
jgi:RND superfamily putative drug exporter